MENFGDSASAVHYGGCGSTLLERVPARDTYFENYLGKSGGKSSP